LISLIKLNMSEEFPNIDFSRSPSKTVNAPSSHGSNMQRTPGKTSGPGETMSPSESGHENALSGELGAWQDPKTGLFPPKDVDPSGDPSFRANCPWPDCRRVIQGNKFWQHVLLPHYPCDKPPAQFSFISIDAKGRERRKYRCCFWTCGKDFFSKASLTKHQKTCEGRLKFGMPLAGYNLQANLQRARPGATEAEVNAVFDILVRRYKVIQGLT